MLIHYLKVAFRNLLKYKTQSVVSLFSLAVAFACVAFSVYWSRYEESFDAFHEKSDRIYWVGRTEFSPSGTRIVAAPPQTMPSYLMNTYPEVEMACGVSDWPLWRFTINGTKIDAAVSRLAVTPETIEMFDFEWLEGDGNVAAWGQDKIAISDKFAERMYGEASPIGEKITLDMEKRTLEIVAVYKAWPRQSNYRFNFLTLYDGKNTSYGDATYVMLKSDADYQAFADKMKKDSLVVNEYWNEKDVYDVITPLTSLHYVNPPKVRNVGINEVRLFSYASIILAICALLNYLTLFISRFFNRGRDMALRAICGSSGWQMSLLLMTEYLLLLLGALMASMVLIELFMSHFMELSQVVVERSDVYKGCAYLLLFVIGLATLLSVLPIYYFRRKTLRVQIEVAPVLGGKLRYRMISVCIQLVVSVLFLFCSTVMISQVYYLVHADFNIQRKDYAVVHVNPKITNLTVDVLRQIPEVKEILTMYMPIFPISGTGAYKVKEWDEKPAGALPFDVQYVYVDDSIANFYGLKMKEGPASFELGEREIFINEAFAKALNVANPINKSVEKEVVKGIIYDYQAQNPKEPIRPVSFRRTLDPTYNGAVLFKYEGKWEVCEKKILEAFEQRDISAKPKESEQEYKEYLTSEYNFLKLLGVITVASVLVALFGIYALLMQECERHRKSIAVRKVNGAQVKDILGMFFKQYMLQVVIASVIAFPIAYVLMKRWLEEYSKQIELGFMLFAAIFVAVSLLVTLCIGWRVWKAANENPAHVIKKE